MPDPFDADALFAQQPTLEVNGKPADDLAEFLLTLEVREDLTGLARLTARFVNLGSTGRGFGYLHFGGKKLAFGHRVVVRVGPSGHRQRIFVGRISALEGLYPEEGPPALEILAVDSLEVLRGIRRAREFRDVRIRDVIETVADEHDLQTEIELLGDAPVSEVIVQARETDLAFLRRLARHQGASLWLDDNTLHFREDPADPTPSGLTLQDELLSCRVRADLVDQVTGLTVTGWDVTADEPIEEQADDSAIDSSLYGRLTGARVMTKAFGERRTTLGRELPGNRDEARMRAESAFLHRAERFVVADGVARETAGCGRAGQWNCMAWAPGSMAGTSWLSYTTYSTRSTATAPTSVRYDRRWRRSEFRRPIHPRAELILEACFVPSRAGTRIPASRATIVRLQDTCQCVPVVAGHMRKGETS